MELSLIFSCITAQVLCPSCCHIVHRQLCKTSLTRWRNIPASFSYTACGYCKSPTWVQHQEFLQHDGRMIFYQSIFTLLQRVWFDDCHRGEMDSWLIGWDGSWVDLKLNDWLIQWWYHMWDVLLELSAVLDQYVSFFYVSGWSEANIVIQCFGNQGLWGKKREFE